MDQDYKLCQVCGGLFTPLESIVIPSRCSNIFYKYGILSIFNFDSCTDCLIRNFHEKLKEAKTLDFKVELKDSEAINCKKWQLSTEDLGFYPIQVKETDKYVTLWLVLDEKIFIGRIAKSKQPGVIHFKEIKSVLGYSLYINSKQGNSIRNRKFIKFISESEANNLETLIDLIESSSDLIEDTITSVTVYEHIYLNSSRASIFNCTISVKDLVSVDELRNKLTIRRICDGRTL